MGLFDSLERRTIPKEVSWSAIEDWLGGGTTESGLRVNESNALQFVALWACVQVIAQDLAKLPLLLYQRRPDGGKDRITDSRHYDLMHVAPDPDLGLSSYEWRLIQQAHVLTWGNCYARRHKFGDGTTRRLEILHPGRVEPKVINGRKVFRYTKDDDTKETLRRGEVIHIKGLGADGVRGYSPVRMAREAIGAGLAADTFAARFWGKGARHDLILRHPKTLSEPAQKRLRTSVDNRVRGSDNQFSTLVLEEDMDVAKITIPPEEAQFLATRQFSVVEMARIYRVSPHKIQELSRATFSNIESQAIEHRTDTLLPWAVAWEQQINLELLTEEERRRGLFFEFLLDAIERADLKSRFEAYQAGVSGGFLAPDEVRRLENRDPKGGQAEKLWMQINMAPIDSAAQDGTIGEDEGSEDEEGDEEEDAERERQRAMRSRVLLAHESRAARGPAVRRRIQQTFRRLLEEQFGRLMRREAKALRKILRNVADSPQPLSTLDDELRELQQSLRPVFVRDIAPVLVSMAEMLQEAVADEFGPPLVTPDDVRSMARERTEGVADGHLRSTRNQLRALATEGDPVAAMEARVGEWEETRAAKEALKASVTHGSLLARGLFAAAGVTMFRWVAFTPCPLCQTLNGRVASIRSSFVPDGGRLDPEDGDTEPLIVERDLITPQAHQGCECTIAPA